MPANSTTTELTQALCEVLGRYAGELPVGVVLDSLSYVVAGILLASFAKSESDLEEEAALFGGSVYRAMRHVRRATDNGGLHAGEE